MGFKISIEQCISTIVADLNFSLLGKKLINREQCNKLNLKTDNTGFRTFFISVDDKRLLRAENPIYITN